VLARRGEHAEAESLARAAVAMSETTDNLESRADALVDLAEVLTGNGRRDEAAEALAAAERLYTEKGHLVGVNRVRSFLAELRAPVTSAIAVAVSGLASRLSQQDLTLVDARPAD
jgi:thioredoxin-like negative regulator of GroEL